MQNRSHQRPESIGCHGQQERRGRPEKVECQISYVERMIDNGAKGDEQSIPKHDCHRDPHHRALGTAAPPRGIDESNQQNGGEDGNSHAGHYPCRLLSVNSPQAAEDSGITSAVAAAGHSLRS